ncbi:unnamed protein product [Clonostachys rosea]|uniref:Deoxyribonuclease NucA/NucB domain-containing protein n=1 Tax=Bionectria ochroleuca TaxID=29856 RepID=A0ABY6U804_BIOOC|nr:unnamed protein product [Clonostachys rosea]
MTPLYKVLIFLIIGQVLAASLHETENTKRAVGTKTVGTKTLKVNVKTWQDIAELDCYAILCDYNGEKKWRKASGGAKAGDDHYIKSGAHLGPFKDTTLRKTRVIKQGFISPEEFPWQSMEQGGTGARLFPVKFGMQRNQGGSISRAYKIAKIKDGESFNLKFINFSSTSVYCKALFQNFPDLSVCKKKRRQLSLAKPSSQAITIILRIRKALRAGSHLSTRRLSFIQ